VNTNNKIIEKNYEDYCEVWLKEKLN
jgi:hypothetical protein